MAMLRVWPSATTLLLAIAAWVSGTALSFHAPDGFHPLLRLACCRSRLLDRCGRSLRRLRNDAAVRSVRVSPRLKPPARDRWVLVVGNACDFQSRWIGVESDHEQHPYPRSESGTSPRSSPG